MEKGERVEGPVSMREHASLSAGRRGGMAAAAVLAVSVVSLVALFLPGSLLGGDVLPGTEELTLEGDIASHLVAGVDRFLLRQIDRSELRRAAYWQRDVSSRVAYEESIEKNRRRLAHITGVRDPRAPVTGFELAGSTTQPALVGRGARYAVHAVRWAAFGDVNGEGLLLSPIGRDPVASVVAIPDADVLPEQLLGLVGGVPEESQFARRLAESGCRVVVPALVDRSRGKFTWWHGRRPMMTNREFLYRSAFELGRGLVGYEVQKVLAAVDRLKKSSPQLKIALMGWGEGGLLALYSAALDTRVDAVCVSGYFDRRSEIWQEPIDRNVFGLLEQFGDAELASMIAPRRLIVEAAAAPDVKYGGEGGGAPARIETPAPADVKREIERAQALTRGLPGTTPIELIVSGERGKGPYGTVPALEALLAALSSAAKLASSSSMPEDLRSRFDPSARLHRAMREMDRHSQQLLRESQWVRKAFMLDRLVTKSEEAYLESIEPFRKFFREEVVGHFKIPPLPPRPRTRVFAEAETHTTYEVLLDVFPDVIAYGLLLVPKDIEAGERRPVVVCQHGLEGRPQSTIGQAQIRYYDMFATRLARRGFVTFAPQNLYIFGDRFRSLQRKSYCIKKTLFSTMVPQHQQIVDWLQTLPFVDPDRVAFYGLSYGGKSAMRIPPLVTDYCLSICSADFNDWVDKNASTQNPRSYVWTGEYEIFEFDLGSTFNYAEMAALIAPRPFMVERGHFDGVADDWTVAWEFAKVRFLYQGRLKMAERCAIEWFDGPHKINGVKTYEFLHKHLQWPAR